VVPFILLFAAFVAVGYLLAFADTTKDTSVVAIFAFTILTWVFVISEDKHSGSGASFNH
jgi:hypothetical protein